MKKTSKTKGMAPAESIARLADGGTDVSPYFTNTGKMMPPLDNLGLDLNRRLMSELDEVARTLKISRRALIKRLIRRGLDEQKSRTADGSSGIPRPR